MCPTPNILLELFDPDGLKTQITGTLGRLFYGLALVSDDGVQPVNLRTQQDDGAWRYV